MLNCDAAHPSGCCDTVPTVHIGSGPCHYQRAPFTEDRHAHSRRSEQHQRMRPSDGRTGRERLLIRVAHTVTLLAVAAPLVSCRVDVRRSNAPTPVTAAAGRFACRRAASPATSTPTWMVRTIPTGVPSGPTIRPRGSICRESTDAPTGPVPFSGRPPPRSSFGPKRPRSNASAGRSATCPTTGSGTCATKTAASNSAIS